MKDIDFYWIIPITEIEVFPADSYETCIICHKKSWKFAVALWTSW